MTIHFDDKLSPTTKKSTNYCFPVEYFKSAIDENIDSGEEIRANCIPTTMPYLPPLMSAALISFRFASPIADPITEPSRVPAWEMMKSS